MVVFESSSRQNMCEHKGCEDEPAALLGRAAGVKWIAPVSGSRDLPNSVLRLYSQQRLAVDQHISEKGGLSADCSC